MKSLFSRLRGSRTDKDKENDPSRQSIDRAAPLHGSVGKKSMDPVEGDKRTTWRGREKAKERRSLPNPIDLSQTRTVAPPARYSPLSDPTNEHPHAAYLHVPRAPSIEPLNAFELASHGGSREECLRAGGSGERSPNIKDIINNNNNNHAKKVAFISPVPTPTASLVLDLIVDSGLDPDAVGEELMRENTESDGRSGIGMCDTGPSGTLRGSSRGKRPSLPMLRTDSGEGDHPGPFHITAQTSDSRNQEHSTGPKALSPVMNSTTYPKSSLAAGSLRSKPSLTSEYNHLHVLPPVDVPYATSAKGPPIHGFSHGQRTRSYSSRPASVAESIPYLSPTMSTPTSSVMGSALGNYCDVRANWSEMADSGYGDLVANLSPRERVRQEVLWEIISSEKRYLGDLLQLRETFIEPLLQKHKEVTPRLPSISLGSQEPQNQPRSESLSSVHSSFGTPTQDHPRQQRSSSSSTEITRTVSVDIDRLPIAARFASPSLGSPDGRWTPSSQGDVMDSAGSPGGASSAVAFAEDAQQSNGMDARQRAGYDLLSHGRPSASNPMATTGRSHHSLPPPPKSQLAITGPKLSQHGMSSTYDRIAERHPMHHRYSLVPKDDRAPSTASTSSRAPAPQDRYYNKLRKRLPSIAADGRPPFRPVELPVDLQEVLRSLDEKIIGGHVSLHAALEQRYIAEYPLVRSLADIFLAHSDLFRNYEIYVLHLEKALNQIDSAMISAETTKRKSSDQGSLDFSAALKAIDLAAASKGEAGLAISISKPFSRLLKYPLLFRNLLFNTDPSMREYEATMRMVRDIENIVLDIEDEKASAEDKERTSDIFSRIEGLEGEKAFIAPRQTRTLIVEIKVENVEHHPIPKQGSKRLSDLLRGHGAASDELWAITFTDVTLLCAKVGTTSVPLNASSMQADQTRSKRQERKQTKAHAGHRRSHQPEQRNLYKFVRTEAWHMAVEVAYAYAGVGQPGPECFREQASDPEASVSDEPATDYQDSDGQSEISFSYDVPDAPQPLLTSQLARDRYSIDSASSRGNLEQNQSNSLPAPPSIRSSTLPRKASVALASSRIGTENAKFGTRLRCSDSPADHAVPALISTRPATGSRARQSAPPSVRGPTMARQPQPNNGLPRRAVPAPRATAETISRATAATNAAESRRHSLAVRPKGSQLTVNYTRAATGVRDPVRKPVIPKHPPGKTWI